MTTDLAGPMFVPIAIALVGVWGCAWLAHLFRRLRVLDRGFGELGLFFAGQAVALSWFVFTFLTTLLGYGHLFHGFWRPLVYLLITVPLTVRLVVVYHRRGT